MNTLVCEVESSLGAKGEVCDKPSLQEMAECIVMLRNVAISRALLLKVGLELTTWLHKVILVVWCSGRALEEWKSTLVVPLYKGKGSHQHKQPLGNQSTKYPRQGLCVVVDAPLRAVCGRPIA